MTVTPSKAVLLSILKKQPQQRKSQTKTLFSRKLPEDNLFEYLKHYTDNMLIKDNSRSPKV